MQLIKIQSPEEMAQFTLHPAVSRTTATQLTLHRPDAHWLAVDDGRQVLGRCSLWWKATATHNDHRLWLYRPLCRCKRSGGRKAPEPCQHRSFPERLHPGRRPPGRHPPGAGTGLSPGGVKRRLFSWSRTTRMHGPVSSKKTASASWPTIFLH